MKTLNYKLVFLVILVFAISTTAQQKLVGKIVDVTDGKTVVIEVNSVRITAVLQYIDVPEPGQQFHEIAKNHLQDLVKGKAATFRPERLFRTATSGPLEVNGVDISEQMLRDGAAWLIPVETSLQEAAQFSAYSEHEAAAKADKLGVWSVPGMKPAWEFRAEVERRMQEAKAKSDDKFQQTRFQSPSATRNDAATSLKPKNVGALLNSFDPKSGSGFFATPMLPVSGLESKFESIQAGFAYVFTEDARKNRKGDFILVMDFYTHDGQASVSNTFAIEIDGAKVANITGSRSNRKAGEMKVERIRYSISRKLLEQMANAADVKLIDGKHFFQPSPGLQLVIYNLLDAAK